MLAFQCKTSQYNLKAHLVTIILTTGGCHKYMWVNNLEQAPISKSLANGLATEQHKL